MKKINISLIGIIVLIIFCLAIGAGIWHFFHLTPKSAALSENQVLRQPGYKFISPLLECSDVRDISRGEVEESIRLIINNKISSDDITYASVYFRDLNNGPWIGINEQEKFTPASLLKVPLLMAYLKIVQSNPSILQEKITIEENPTTLTQNITPSTSVKIGTAYTVDELLQKMIIYSDNQAANSLLRYIDANSLNQTYSDLGIKVPSGNATEDFMSVLEYASFFRILYNASYLNHDMSEKALEILTKSQFHNGLAAGVPDNIEIAHKFGERVFANNNQLHDCGIIYKNKSPYLLCIMTRGDDFNKMTEAIKEISQYVYNQAQ